MSEWVYTSQKVIAQSCEVSESGVFVQATFIINFLNLNPQRHKRGASKLILQILKAYHGIKLFLELVKKSSLL